MACYSNTWLALADLMVSINLDFPDSLIIEKAAAVIRQGGVVLYPTDTLYGLGCDPFQPEALQRLLDLKGRPEQKGLLVLVPGLKWVEPLVAEIPPWFGPLAEELWPGPVTFLFRGGLKLPKPIGGEEGKVGIRLPGVRFLDDWMQAIPGPLVSTSANRSGEPPLRSLAELESLFKNRVDLFLEAGEPKNLQPSSVVDLTFDPPVLAREGREADNIRERLKRY